MNSINLYTLRDVIKCNLHIESYSIEELAQWVKSVEVPDGIKMVQTFKEELRTALDNPGIVTPKTYKQWTHDDELTAQSQVQQRLQEVWNACFG